MNKILNLLTDIPADVREALENKLHVINQVTYAEEHYKHNPALPRAHEDDRAKAKLYLIEVAEIILTYATVVKPEVLAVPYEGPVYACRCGNYNGKVNLGFECSHCNTNVELIQE